MTRLEKPGQTPISQSGNWMSVPVLLRRHFLLAATAAALRAQGLKNPFFALCHDTHDANKRDLAQQAEMLKSLGYDGAGHLWFDKVDERLATLDRHNLRLFQIYMRIDVAPQAKQPYDPKLAAVLPLLKGRNVQLAALINGGKPSDPAHDERAVTLVRDIAQQAAPHGVQVALYPHANNWLEKVEDSIRIATLADRPNVGAMFNLCHWLKSEDEAGLRPLLAKARPRLISVSINGADRGADVKSGKGNWIQPLDSGTFNIPNFLAELSRIGYQGPIGLQCYGIPGDVAIHLKRSMTAWQQFRRAS